MASARSFEDLEVWKNARTLAVTIYRITGRGAFSRDFGLKDQLRRSILSVASNIAEGFERGGNREFVHFLNLAKGSAAEVRAQLYIASDLNYLNSVEAEETVQTSLALSRKLSALIRYLEDSYQTTGRNTRTEYQRNFKP